jgi:hypothetical protein
MMATDNDWKNFDFEGKITSILRAIAKDDPEHYGQPFFTAYQLAIEFAKQYPQDFAEIGKPIGGRKTGEKSLAWYIAWQLS